MYTAVNVINILKFFQRFSNQCAALLAFLFAMFGFTVFGFGICVALFVKDRLLDYVSA